MAKYKADDTDGGKDKSMAGKVKSYNSKTPSTAPKSPSTPKATFGSAKPITNNREVSDVSDGVSHIHRDPSKGNHVKGDFTNKD